jgi:hypothetical protein
MWLEQLKAKKIQEIKSFLTFFLFSYTFWNKIQEETKQLFIKNILMQK